MTGLLGDLAFGTACLLVGGACGWLAGFRRGVARTWLLAVLAYLLSTRAVHAQLTEAERALADRAEADHAAARGMGGWVNPRYVSRSFDSPARPGVGQPQGVSVE